MSLHITPHFCLVMKNVKMNALKETIKETFLKKNVKNKWKIIFEHYHEHIGLQGDFLYSYILKDLSVSQDEMNAVYFPKRDYFYKKLHEFRKRNRLKSGKEAKPRAVEVGAKAYTEEEMDAMGGDEAFEKLSEEQLSQWRKRKLKLISSTIFSTQKKNTKL